MGFQKFLMGVLDGERSLDFVAYHQLRVREDQLTLCQEGMRHSHRLLKAGS